MLLHGLRLESSRNEWNDFSTNVLYKYVFYISASGAKLLTSSYLFILYIRFPFFFLIRATLSMLIGLA